jgi:hypothetical protein
VREEETASLRATLLEDDLEERAHELVEEDLA